MPRAGHGDPGARSRLIEEKATNVKDAITRALAILDPDQRELARKILDDRGANDASEQQGPRGFGPDGPRAAKQTQQTAHYEGLFLAVLLVQLPASW